MVGCLGCDFVKRWDSLRNREAAVSLARDAACGRMIWCWPGPSHPSRETEARWMGHPEILVVRAKIRGSLHCAGNGETVPCFGRDDVLLLEAAMVAVEMTCSITGAN